MTTRILGGRGRGRRLRAPGGLLTRPTGARVRQTLFDILAPRLPGCRFLDPFAGSGAVGLEALSRGARAVVLVDSSQAAVAAIRENVRSLADASADLRVHRQDALVALHALAERGELFDVIYLDPPYASDLHLRSLQALSSSRLLAPEGVAVAQHFHKSALPETIGRLVRRRSVRIGDHVLSFFHESPEESGLK